MSNPPINLDELRQRAQRAIGLYRDQASALNLDEETQDLGRLVEELRVYQAELEIQNQELNAAQHEISQALAKYRALYENLPLPGFLVDPLGFIVEANQQASECLHLGRSSSLNRLSIYQLFEPESRTALYERLKGAWLGSPLVLVNLRLKLAKGTSMPVDGHILHLGASEGQEAGCLVILVDRRSEEALAHKHAQLKESDARLKKIAARVPGFVYQYERRSDGSACFPYASEGIRTIYRLPPEDVRETAEPIDRLIHPDDAGRMRASIETSAQTLAPWQFEYRVRFDDDSVRWLEGNSVPEPLPQGGVLWHGYIADSTERKLAQETIRKNEQQLRTLLETAPDGILLINREGHIELCNPAAASLFCYAAEEMRGLPLTRLMILKAPPGSGQWQADVGAAKPWMSPECLGVRKDGGTFPLEITIRGNTCVLRDITQQKAQEAAIRDLNAGLERKVAQRTTQLELASRAKSEFLANMSHEIRTPLNAILGLAQLLTRDALTTDQHEIVKRLGEAGKSLLHIINDILDFSKIEAGQLTIEKYVFELAELLDHLDTVLSLSAREKGITLSIRSQPGLPPRLVGDPLRIKQVLVNLGSNAIKFTERGAVEIVVRPVMRQAPERWLRFEVRDTGIGIPSEQQPRLFEPFIQGDTSTTRRFGGTGLGLSISKRLVELMGGEIAVESVPGQGSRFWFELPLEAAPMSGIPADPAPARSPPPPGNRQPGLRVLAVDDNRINLFMLERALKLEGAIVILAADGQQALQTLRANPHGFDVVLMDIQMPVMDGLTATRAIREDPDIAMLPVIALTAGVLAEEREKALAAGFTDFIAKPVNLEEMVALLGALPIRTVRDATAG